MFVSVEMVEYDRRAKDVSVRDVLECHLYMDAYVGGCGRLLLDMYAEPSPPRDGVVFSHDGSTQS